MPDAVWLLAAFVFAQVGMGWLALAMDVHWLQVRGSGRPHRRVVIALRILGSAALVFSLWLCLLADTATMAVLVWMMLLAVSASAVAFVLSWRPKVLARLVSWAGDSATDP